MQPIYEKSLDISCNQILIYNNNFKKIKIGKLVEIIGISRNIPSFFSNKVYGNLFFNTFIEGLYIIEVNIDFEYRVSIYNTNFNKKHLENFFLKNKKIILSSIIQNFYLFSIFIDNFAIRNCGFETLKRIIFFQIIASKRFDSIKNKKKVRILLLNYFNTNIEFFFQSVSKSFYNISSFFFSNNIDKIILNHNIDHFSINSYETTENWLKCMNNRFSINNIDASFINKICKMYEILVIQSDFKKIRKKEYFTDREAPLVVSMNIEKKEPFLIRKIKKNLLIFNKFTFVFFIKSLTTIKIDRNQFSHKLNFYIKHSQKFLVNTDIKYFKLGLSLKALANFPNELSKYKTPAVTKFTKRDYLKLKNLIYISNNLHKITVFGYVENFYDHIIQFSEVNSILRLSNTIGPMDIRFSILLLLEAVKSINVKEKKNF